MRRHLLVATGFILLLITSCGDIEWLPSGSVNNEPTPSPFTFAPILCAPAATLAESKEIEISNVTSPATISITNGEYSIAGGTWSSESRIVTPDSTQKLKVRVRHTAASVTASSPVVITTLKVGNTTGYFYSDTSTSTGCPQ